MSARLLSADVDATIDHIGSTTALCLRGAVVVRQAAAVRLAVRDFLDSTDPTRHAVIDMSAVEELDAAGLAAVTSPVLRSCRAGRMVSVVPPMAAAPRRLADQVGVLPLGAG